MSGVSGFRALGLDPVLFFSPEGQLMVRFEVGRDREPLVWSIDELDVFVDQVMSLRNALRVAEVALNEDNNDDQPF